MCEGSSDRDCILRVIEILDGKSSEIRDDSFAVYSEGHEYDAKWKRDLASKYFDASVLVESLLVDCTK